jgi:hypothetical protein
VSNSKQKFLCSKPQTIGSSPVYSSNVVLVKLVNTAVINKNAHLKKWLTATIIKNKSVKFEKNDSHLIRLVTANKNVKQLGCRGYWFESNLPDKHEEIKFGG